MMKLPVRSVTLVVSVVLSAEMRTQGPAGRLTVTFWPWTFTVSLTAELVVLMASPTVPDKPMPLMDSASVAVRLAANPELVSRRTPEPELRETRLLDCPLSVKARSLVATVMMGELSAASCFDREKLPESVCPATLTLPVMLSDPVPLVKKVARSCAIWLLSTENAMFPVGSGVAIRISEVGVRTGSNMPPE